MTDHYKFVMSEWAHADPGEALHAAALRAYDQTARAMPAGRPLWATSHRLASFACAAFKAAGENMKRIRTGMPGIRQRRSPEDPPAEPPRL